MNLGGAEWTEKGHRVEPGLSCNLDASWQSNLPRDFDGPPSTPHRIERNPGLNGENASNMNRLTTSRPSGPETGCRERTPIAEARFDGPRFRGLGAVAEGPRGRTDEMK